MATTLIDDLRARLSGSDAAVRAAVGRDPYGLLKALSTLANGATEDEDGPAHELIVRACEWRDAFGPYAPALDALIRQRGLFPYLRPEALPFADRFAYEIHRPLAFDTVFHRVQARVYHRLLGGANVVLSAPTSFGKSLIVDAMIATGRFQNVAVVVPTIALIDETRRRLVERFGDSYRIVTRVGQSRAERGNLFVLTQERVVEFGSLPVDFFALDEFYKLDPEQEDPDRSAILNEALYRLARTGAQFYMLGPNIRSIPEVFTSRYRCEFIRTDYATVVTEEVSIPTARNERLETLARLCRKEMAGEPALVYCSSPESARTVAAGLVATGIGRERPELLPAAEWAAEHFHPEWGLVHALRRGIGVHHGKLPRALAQYMVRAFNNEILDILVCTSTLIEGVNTKAKHVVIYDNRLAGRKLTYFACSNIKGRSGRMRRHFVGRVYLLHPRPAPDMPAVDVPMATQTDSAPNSLLIQLEDEDLSDDARARVAPFRAQAALPLSVLQENRGIDPDAQIRLAERLRADPAAYWIRLRWRGPTPGGPEVQQACDLIWEYFVPQGGARDHGARSARQLATRIDRLRTIRNVRLLIEEELTPRPGIAGPPPDPDTAVEDTLDFLRYWAGYHFPRYLMALHRIQEVVFSAVGYEPGDYSAFAAQVENYFASPGIAGLDEYGIPLQVGLKLAVALGEPDNLDAALDALSGLDVRRLTLSTFERELVLDAQRFL